jgi:hypothetical protein
VQPTPAKRAVLQVMVEASLSGHELTPFEAISTGGYFARCRRCDGTVNVGDDGNIFSLLAPRCPG